MLTYFKDKEGVARYVNELLENSRKDSLSTMTILPGESGGYYVLTATATGLVDGSEQTYPSFPVY